MKKKNPSLRSGQKDSLTVRLRSPQALLRVTSLEQKEILKKLDTLQDLLKKKDDKPLTFKEACAYLGYAPSYLYKLTYRKVIPHYKPTGKMIFFSKSELDQWVYKSNVKLRIENEDFSTSLGVTNENEDKIKDPNQIEMNLGEEIVIEFPRKKRK